MARKGSFGRSGGSQNLSLLIYSLLKDQMTTDLQSVLTAYESNMTAGRYASQYNGQNVDGKFVLDYYQKMLAGFPQGSTEYETISSRLRSFEQRYEADVQNLVVNAMQNGTQIDFGLLGDSFSNKGIADVNLTDMQAWATSRIAMLEENGQTTEADALKGTLFVAEFNVERDGKEAAYYRGDITAGQMSKWLNGQLKDALAGGMTKDSKAYRDILTLAGQYAKTAKTEDQNKQFESYQEKVYSYLDPLEQVARQLLENYSGADGQFKEKISELAAGMEGDFPAFALLQKLAEGDQNGDYAGILKDIMATSNSGTGVDIQDVFSQATLEASRGLADLYNGSLTGISPSQKRALSSFIWKNKNNLTTFVVNAGSNIDGGFAVGTDKLTSDLGAAGMVQKFDPETGRNLMIGGQPDLVFGSFKNLKTAAGGAAQTGWLDELAEGFIPSSVIDAKRFGGADGKVSFDELSQAIVDGTISAEQYQNIQDQVTISSQNLYMPNRSSGGGVDAISVVNAAMNAVYNQARISMGDVMVIRPNGMVEVTDNPFKGGGQSQAMPYFTMYKGKLVTAYAQPAKMYMDGDAAGPAEWPGAGFKVAIYKTPGNTEGSDEFGGGNYTVTISGKFKQEDGSELSQVRQVPLRAWTEYLEKNGVPTDGLSDLGDGTFGMKITEGMDLGENISNGQFLKDMWTRSNTNSVWSIPDASNLDEYDTYNIGSLSSTSTNKKIISDAFSDKTAILAKATEIAKAQGRSEAAGPDILSAVMENFPALYEGSNTTLLTDTRKTSKPFIDAFNAAFPGVNMDSGGGFGFMPTGFDPVGFFRGVNKGYATGDESKYLGRYGAVAKAGAKAHEDRLAREAANNSTTINPPATSGSMSSKFTDTAFRNFRMGERENLKIAPPPQIKPSSTYKASPSTPLNNVIKPRGR
jgi:hypothetical protein